MNSRPFAIAEDHIILRFKAEKDCSLHLKGGPWFVAGQLLAMEHWEPNFVPSQRLENGRVDEVAGFAIEIEAGKPMAIDDFTDLLLKTEYARIRVEIDAASPLKPGVLIKERKDVF